jgi:hypothetical protein
MARNWTNIIAIRVFHDGLPLEVIVGSRENPDLNHIFDLEHIAEAIIGKITGEIAMQTKLLLNQQC